MLAEQRNTLQDCYLKQLSGTFCHEWLENLKHVSAVIYFVIVAVTDCSPVLSSLLQKRSYGGLLSIVRIEMFVSGQFPLIG